MYRHTIELPDTFYVVAVPVATVWTSSESVREMDQPATENPANIEEWLDALSERDKAALIKENRIQTQALYGETVLVREVTDGWAKVVLPYQATKKDDQGYPGWMPFHQLKKVKRKTWDRPEMVAIKHPTYWLERENKKERLLLSYMTCLPVERVKGAGYEVITPHGKGYLPLEAVHIFPANRGVTKKDGEKILEAGKQFIGLAYLWGGMSAFGYDCSGLTYRVHKANGYRIARDAEDQAGEGEEVAVEDLLPGDLLFFAYDKEQRNIEHVGIYAGEGKMLHAPSAGKGIELISLQGTKYEDGFCIARRYWKSGDDSNDK
jgi:hypothetical protein